MNHLNAETGFMVTLIGIKRFMTFSDNNIIVLLESKWTLTNYLNKKYMNSFHENRNAVELMDQKKLVDKVQRWDIMNNSIPEVEVKRHP